MGDPMDPQRHIQHSGRGVEKVALEDLLRTQHILQELTRWGQREHQFIHEILDIVDHWLVFRQLHLPDLQEPFDHVHISGRKFRFVHQEIQTEAVQFGTLFVIWFRPQKGVERMVTGFHSHAWHI